MVLILTATIRPANGVFNLSLKDENERCKQYKDALIYYIKNIPGIKIVLCDNSDTDISEFDDIFRLSQENNCQFEILSFKGNIQETVKRGKGFGESEIVTYALENSKLLQEDIDNYFVKVTGRLILTNLAKQMQSFNREIIYINSSIDGNGRTIADTRTFAMNTDSYNKYFKDAGAFVDDHNDVFLESIFYDRIQKFSLVTRNMPYYPRIVGISGSNGYQYSYTEWKCKIKDILSKFNHYGVKYGKF